MRDAFMVPLKWKGLSLNTTNPKELVQAQSLLLKQKPIVEAYLVDEARDALIMLCLKKVPTYGLTAF